MLNFLYSLIFFPPAVCSSTFTYMQYPKTDLYSVQYETCIDIARNAILVDLDPYKAVSAGIQESDLIPGRVSTANARGPLQVTHFWCAEDIEDCDLVFAGARALKLLRTCKYINWNDYFCNRELSTPLEWEEVFCHYNAGNVCNEASYSYANDIINRAEKIKNIGKSI